MNKLLIASLLFVITLSCTKEDPQGQPNEKMVPASEIEALRNEINELKAKVEALSSSTALDELNQKVDGLAPDYIEVEGLRFNKNGEVVSIQKIEKETVATTPNYTLKTTRTLDAQGRLVEIYSKYSNYSGFQGEMLPYYWKKTMYEYSGKTVTITTQHTEYGMSVSIPYIEENSTITYW